VADVGSGRFARLGLAVMTAALAWPVAAHGSVIIGRTADPVGSSCATGFDWIGQETPTTSYVVPGTGGVTSWTVTSWSTFAGPTGGSLTMKVFRPLPGDKMFQVVGHDGPETVTPAGLAGNTFPANLSVKAGDVLGFHNPTLGLNCTMPEPGGTYLYLTGDLADGASGGPFGIYDAMPYDLNISATVSPVNDFTIGKTSRNRKKGTATITVDLPNPGSLSGSAGGAKVSKAKAVAAGKAKLKVKARGLKRRTLNSNGKLKLKLQVIYTPTAGDPKVKKLKVKLLKN
jgi:hypothetical protein